MDLINTYEAKRNLSALLKRVQAGETIIIASHNKPVAELRPIQQKPLEPRPMGLCKGEFEVPDDFNDPLPQKILDEFYDR
jgi:prevent-host-death family protein